ncbi:MAG: tetratricopeptide repeat protein [Candidatus Riflebacteria bacterium]|nr:tetratricopeptide repeat protein [Candidatus Riflebacteria bacterium]
MLKKLLRTLLLTALYMVAASCQAQPFDTIIPGSDSPDSLSQELRNLQAVERDLAIEKLTHEPSRLEAYIELADLRLSQGKLQEAQRFYEMALEISPKNNRATQGMVMVHYHLGEFNLARERIETIHKSAPLSDFNRSEIEKYKRKLQTEGSIGLSIREDDQGLLEVVSSIDGYFPSEYYPKISARYRFENWSHEDNNQSVSSRVFSGTLNYRADDLTSLQVSFAPEIFPGGDSIDSYSLLGIGGTDNLKLALRAGKSAYKDNFFTVQNRYQESTTGISFYGDLHRRTRAVQTVTLGEISDGNSRRRYDSELIHAVFYQNAPLLTATLRFYQTTFANQTDQNGNQNNYWTPSDHKGAEFALAWEKSVGANWWWGMDGSYISSRYSFDNATKKDENGAGATIFIGYRFSEGQIFASLGDRLHEYYRERRLEVAGNILF